MADPLWTSAEIVAATGGRLEGPAFGVRGVSIDSRSVVGSRFARTKCHRSTPSAVAQPTQLPVLF